MIINDNYSHPPAQVSSGRRSPRSWVDKIASRHPTYDTALCQKKDIKEDFYSVLIEIIRFAKEQDPHVNYRHWALTRQEMLINLFFDLADDYEHHPYNRYDDTSRWCIRRHILTIIFRVWPKIRTRQEIMRGNAIRVARQKQAATDKAVQFCQMIDQGISRQDAARQLGSPCRKTQYNWIKRGREELAKRQERFQQMVEQEKQRQDKAQQAQTLSVHDSEQKRMRALYATGSTQKRGNAPVGCTLSKEKLLKGTTYESSAFPLTNITSGSTASYRLSTTPKPKRSCPPRRPRARHSR